MCPAVVCPDASFNSIPRMKNQGLLFVLLLLGGCASGLAQAGLDNKSATPDRSDTNAPAKLLPYDQWAEKGPHHHRVSYTSQEQLPSGETATVTRSYVEMATGMHYV